MISIAISVALQVIRLSRYEAFAQYLKYYISKNNFVLLAVLNYNIAMYN